MELFKKKGPEQAQSQPLHDMDPNWVVGHAYDAASYILANRRPIKDGDTLDGVLDICMNEYAAGNRRSH